MSALVDALYTIVRKLLSEHGAKPSEVSEAVVKTMVESIAEDLLRRMIPTQITAEIAKYERLLFGSMLSSDAYEQLATKAKHLIETMHAAEQSPTIPKLSDSMTIEEEK